jgi:hypothetical protein
MDAQGLADLGRFAHHAGFDPGPLAADGEHWIEHGRNGFSGNVEALRITSYGRFGNVVYQTLHAIVLARHLGCSTIFASPLTVSSAGPVLEIEGLRIVLDPPHDEASPAVSRLAGHFFIPGLFGGILTALPPAEAARTVTQFLHPIFNNVMKAVRPLGDRTLAVSFRSGDIFSGEPVHRYYVQPPATFYIRAIEFARAELGIGDVRLVYEDDANPAIGCVQSYLTRQDIPWAVQSADVVSDLACLVGASHLVAPFSTFVEAAAMLSPHIRSYIAFRNFESHQPLWRRNPAFLAGVLRMRDVRRVLIDDAAGGYIPPFSWQRTDAQLRQIVDYAIDNLVLMEGAEADAREIAAPYGGKRDEIDAAWRDVACLRPRLIAEAGAAECARAAARAAYEERDALAGTLAEQTCRAADIDARLDAAQARIATTEQQLAATEAALDATRNAGVVTQSRQLARALRRAVRRRLG